MDKSFLTPRVEKVKRDLKRSPELAKAAVFFHGPACDVDGGRRDVLELSMVVPSLDEKVRQTLHDLNGGFLGWDRRGIQLRFLFTPEYIRNAQDTFPLEFLDLASRHFPIQGDPGFARLKLDPKALRLQCERELRGLILHGRSAQCRVPAHGRRQGYLLAHLKWSFVPIARGLLRLKKADVTGSRDKVLASVTTAYFPKQKMADAPRTTDEILALMESLLPAVDRA